MNIARLVVAVLLMQIAPAPQAPQGPTGLIEGVVVRLGSGEPIAGADVELSRVDVFQITPDPTIRPGFPGSPPPPKVYKATTREDGQFSLKELAGGRYRLVVTKSGGMFSPGEYGQRDPRQRGTTIQLANGQRLSNIRLSMAQTGSISGRIIDDEEPVANARVMALELTYRNGKRTMNVVQSVLTNDLGEYRLFWLRAGRYYVAALRQDPRGINTAVHVFYPDQFGSREDATGPSMRDHTLEDGRVVEEADMVVYYGGGFEERRAQAIELAAGTTVSAIDVPLQNSRVQTRHVKGVVIGAAGQPMTEALVRLIPQQSAAHSIIPSAVPDKQGAFNIPGVAPGAYYLYATAGSSSGYSFVQSFLDIADGASARLPIEVADHDVENVNLMLKASFSLPGHIYADGKLPANFKWDLSSPRVSLARDPDLIGMPNGRLPGPSRGIHPDGRPINISPSGTPDANGSFVLNGFGPGDYRVDIVGIPSSAYVKTIRHGDVDVLHNGFHVDSNPDGQLDILINLEGARLEGVAMNEKSEPVTNATIVLVPDIPLRNQVSLYKFTESDSKGRYELVGLPPGDYKVFAWDFIERGIWFDPEFIRTVENQGKPIRISEGGVQQLQVTVSTR